MILMIDDEKRTLDSYLDELKMSNFEVRYELSVDAGLSFLEDNADAVELLILDIMMPAGLAFNNEDNERGLKTGVLFHQRLRKSNDRLPVIILTNNVQDGIRRVFDNDPHCRFFWKEELLPFELADLVKDVLEHESAGRQTS
jgi:DNA-binding response OmpR family regulator